MGEENKIISTDKKGVSNFEPLTDLEKAALLSAEAARAANTSNVARESGDTKAADRLLNSAREKSQKALDSIK